MKTIEEIKHQLHPKDCVWCHSVAPDLGLTCSGIIAGMHCIKCGHPLLPQGSVKWEELAFMVREYYRMKRKYEADIT